MEARFSAGTKWSGIGHGVAILWILLGDWLFSPRSDIEIIPTQVSMMTSAEFEAMQSTSPSPAAADAPDQMAAVETPEPVQPDTPQIEESPAPPARPEPAPQPAPEPEPVPVQVPDPVVPEQVAEPEPQPVAEPQPEDLALAPVEQPMPSMSSSTRPKPKPADRVAPDPVSVPEEAVTSDAPQEAVSEEPVETPQPPQEAQTETVPEESGDVLRTEATDEQDESLGMTASIRPKARPSRPAAPAATERPSTPAAAAEAADDSDADAIAAAVAAAAAEPAERPAQSGGSSAPSGPPLNAGEIGDIRSAVGNKWNLGAASSDVMRTTVVIRVTFDRSGKPTDISLLESDAPSAEARDVAFAAGRRAIQRAYVEGGIPLPADKYETWKVLDFVFDANGMRLR